MKQTKLQVKSLSKNYPHKNLAVLDDISFSVTNNEFVSFIGPSGCGKSTLFNIISGAENQTSGEIIISNKKLKNRRGLFGYMTQNPSLLPWRNTISNISLGLDIKNNDKKNSLKKSLNLLKLFGLQEFAGYYPDQLSGGMKQRIALLRTILFNDKLLLLDEPFGALDALTRIECQKFLLDLKKRLNPTTLFVTHDIREAILLSDRIFVLSSAPARIIKELEVIIPHPRKFEYLSTKKALKLESEIFSLLKNE